MITVVIIIIIISLLLLLLGDYVKDSFRMFCDKTLYFAGLSRSIVA